MKTAKEILTERHKDASDFNFEKELKAGRIFEFLNDDHYSEIVYRKTFNGAFKFKIWFNGVIVHTSITFDAAERKINQLIEKYDLK